MENSEHDSESYLPSDEEFHSSQDSDSLSDIMPVRDSSEVATSEESLGEEAIEDGDESLEEEVIEYDDEVVEQGGFNFTWSKEPFFCNAQRPFKPTDGQTHNFDRFNRKGLMGFFFLFFPLEFWNKVVTYTNAYATIHAAPNSWTPVTISEIFIFLLVLLIFESST